MLFKKFRYTVAAIALASTIVAPTYSTASAISPLSMMRGSEFTVGAPLVLLTGTYFIFLPALKKFREKEILPLYFKERFEKIYERSSKEESLAICNAFIKDPNQLNTEHLQIVLWTSETPAGIEYKETVWDPEAERNIPKHARTTEQYCKWAHEIAATIQKTRTRPSVADILLTLIHGKSSRFGTNNPGTPNKKTLLALGGGGAFIGKKIDDSIKRNEAVEKEKEAKTKLD